VSPPFDWQALINENHIPVRAHAIDDPVDPVIVKTLTERIPEFVRAYDEHGMTVAEFDSFGATARTLRQFLDACAQLDALIRDILIPAP
jgi:transaldolase